MTFTVCANKQFSKLKSNWTCGPPRSEIYSKSGWFVSHSGLFKKVGDRQASIVSGHLEATGGPLPTPLRPTAPRGIESGTRKTLASSRYVLINDVRSGLWNLIGMRSRRRLAKEQCRPFYHVCEPAR